MYVAPFREVTPMVRMFTAAALVVLSTSAFAQFMEPVKGIKYGDGCIGPVSTYAARLGGAPSLTQSPASGALPVRVLQSDFASGPSSAALRIGPYYRPTTAMGRGPVNHLWDQP